MQTAAGESSAWPTTRWELASPESYVLLHGADRLDGEPFKLAVLELVGRRALKLVELEESGLFGMRNRASVLAAGSEPKRQRERSLATVQEIFELTPLHGFSDGTLGVSVRDFARVAQRRYNPISQYPQLEVLPTLVERGYLVYEKRKILGIFPTGRYVLTQSGLAARDDLQRRIELGQANLPGWVENDPNHAMLYLALAGSSLFLAPMLFGDIGELHRRQAETAFAAPGGAESGDLEAPERTVDASELGGLDPTAAGSLDLGAFDLGGLDLESLAGLDSAFDAMDSGLDSGWGGGDGGFDGGGDSGGGDGGDGGGGGGGGGGD